MLGCSKGVTVHLDATNKHVAFFGPNIRCVAIQPLEIDPTEKEVPPPQKTALPKKRIPRKKSVVA
jgi:hypothetical protein